MVDIRMVRRAIWCLHVWCDDYFLWCDVWSSMNDDDIKDGSSVDMVMASSDWSYVWFHLVACWYSPGCETANWCQLEKQDMLQPIDVMSLWWMIEMVQNMMTWGMTWRRICGRDGMVWWILVKDVSHWCPISWAWCDLQMTADLSLMPQKKFSSLNDMPNLTRHLSFFSLCCIVFLFPFPFQSFLE